MSVYMKNKLIILSDWTYPLEKTWSGTPFSIANALSSFYNIIYIKTPIDRFMLLLRKLSKLPIIGSLLGALYTKTLETKTNKILSHYSGIPVLEIPDDIKINNPYFIYADMSYIAGQQVKRMKRKHPWMWSAADNESLGRKEMNRRIRVQQDCYINSEKVFFMSNWVANIMKAYPKYKEELVSKFVHVGGGTNIDINKIQDGHKKGNKFLFIGRDFERKGGSLVIKAFSILRDKFMPNAELYIAGPKTNPATNINGAVFCGDATYEQVSELFNSCDVFVMPSRFEAYGLVFIEALIYGLPCIGRNFFEMSYFINDGENGYTIEEENATLLAEKMYNLINDKSIIENVRRNRSKYIEKYTWNAVALRMKKEIDVLFTNK